MIYAFRFKVLQLSGHMVQETVQGTLQYILDTGQMPSLSSGN